MLQIKRPDGLPGRIVRELLVYSGQFALFYLIMGFSRAGGGFLLETMSMALIGALGIQAALLGAYGHNPAIRLTASFITPAVYSLMTSATGPGFALDAVFAAFWAFSVVTAVFVTVAISAKSRLAASLFDFLASVAGAASFAALYFYYVTADTIDGMIRSGLGGSIDAAVELAIPGIVEWVPVFTSHPGNLFVIFSALLLMLASALARQQTLRTTYRIQDLFGRYADVKSRDEVIAGATARPNRTELCALVIGIRGFTDILAANEPQLVIDMLNAWFDRLSELMRRHGGIVDAFTGDRVTVLFGLRPGKRQRKASTIVSPCEKAVSVLIELQDSLPALRKELRQRDLPDPKEFDAGLHFGATIVGIVGCDRRREFTALGGAVNIAVQLGHACATLKSPCVVSEAAYSRLEPSTQHRFKALARIRIQGSDTPLKAYGFDSTGGV